MADISSTILAIFKADTKPYERAVKKLKGENKKLAQEQLESLEKQNQGLDDQLARWGKVAAGIGAVVGTYATLQMAAKKFAEQSRLESAALGKDIDAIQQAGAGLVTRFQALELAAKTANSQFSATQREMEEATRFAVLLSERGMGPLEQTLEEVTKALVEGNVEGLKQFGIQIDAQSDTLEGFEAIMSRIREENEGAATAIAGAGTAAEKAGVKWQDALDRLVIQLGRIAQALAPIITLTADLAQTFGDILTGNIRGESDSAAANLNALLSERRDVADGTPEANLLDRRISEQRKFLRNKINRQLAREAAEEERQRRERALRNFVDPGAQFPALPPGLNPDGSRRGRANPISVGQGGSVFLGGAPGIPAFASNGPINAGSSLIGAIKVPDEIAKATKQIDPMLQVVGSLTEAFGGLQQAAGQAFADMILGADSFGNSFKKAMGEVLRSLVSQLAGTAIVEGVQAIAALARGDLRGAALHGKAAASAGAGAVAVGVLARGLGVATPGAGALPAAASGGGGARRGGDSSNVTIFVGSDFAENPRANAQRLQRQFRRAQRQDTGADTVLFA